MKTINKLVVKSSVLTAVAIFCVATAHATTIKLGYGSHHSGNGGEFAVTAATTGTTADKTESLAFVTAIAANYDSKARFNGGFETFCIQRSEYFTPGHDYNIGISSMALSEGDPVSVGTAYLYCLFATGQLTGYNYASNTSAGNLQNTFWFLENEGIANPGTFNSLLSAEFGAASNWTLTNATSLTRGAVTAASYGVAALNVGPAPKYSNQDQLIYRPVPDGGATVALLGVALGGLALLRRKLA